MSEPQVKLRQVDADRVVSELLKDRLDIDSIKSNSGRISATMAENNLRSAITLIQTLGFAVAEVVAHD